MKIKTFIILIILTSNIFGAQLLFREACKPPKLSYFSMNNFRSQRNIDTGKRWQSRMLHSLNQQPLSPRINVRDLDLSFNHKAIFKNLDFTLSRGDKVTIVGENGVGKSSFLRLLLGEIANYDGYLQVQGNLGYLPQSFEQYQGNRVIEHFLNYAHDHMMLDLLHNSQQRFTAAWYEEFNRRGGFSFLKSIAQVGLTQNFLEKYFHELSGGEKTKIHLCTLEYSNPDILLLDEPTNHLDSVGIRWLGRFLNKFQGGVVMVTHDRSLISHTANRISELSPITHQFTHFRGGYKNYILEQEKDYERKRNERLHQEKEIKILKSRLAEFSSTTQSAQPRRSSKDRDKLGFNARGERKQKGQSQFVNQIKQKVETLEENLTPIVTPRQKINLSFDMSENIGKLEIQVEHLSKLIGGQLLFDSLTFELGNFERLVITGRNGSGKTTLLRIIYGSILPNKGSFRLSSNARIGFLDQEQDTLDLEKSAFEALSKYQSDRSQDANIIQFLEKFGIYHTHDLYSPLKNLSIGCRRKLQLAEIIWQGCNILLLDEPTNHIDLFSLEKIEEQILSFPGIVIAVSHDQYFIDKVATKTINIEEFKRIHS